MIAAVVWLLPISTQLRKSAAGDIIPSLARLKKHEYVLKFRLDFPKIRSNQYTKSRKVATLENCEILSNLYL